MNVSIVKSDHLISRDLNVSNEDTNTYDTIYIYDVHTNKYNPNKMSTNTFLYKLNRRLNDIYGHHDIESLMKSNDKRRLYNTK